jgi:hypothetical protein
MTDETTDSTTGDTTDTAAPAPELKDFITGFEKKATYEAGTATMAHNGDGITVTMQGSYGKEPYTKIIIKKLTTERINRTKLTMGIFGPRPEESKETVPDKTELITLDATTSSVHIINDKERTESRKEGALTLTDFYDYNIYASLVEAYTAKGKLSVVTVTPPPPPADTPGEVNWMKYLPWIIAGVAAVVIVAVIIWSLRAKSSTPVVVAAPAAAPVVAAPSGGVVHL